MPGVLDEGSGMSENEQYDKFIAESGVGFGCMVSGSDDREKRLKEIDAERHGLLTWISDKIPKTEENIPHGLIALLLADILTELKKLNVRGI